MPCRGAHSQKLLVFFLYPSDDEIYEELTDGITIYNFFLPARHCFHFITVIPLSISVIPCPFLPGKSAALLTFLRVNLVNQIGSTKTPQQVLISYCGLSSSHFSIFSCGMFLPLKPSASDLGDPLDTTFALPIHCKAAANTATRLLFMAWRWFAKLL